MDIVTDNNKNKITDPFDKVLNDLKRIKTLISSINEENFLNNENTARTGVNDLIRIISNYEASINTISTIEDQMDTNEYSSFVSDLNININQFKRNLRKIFTIIMDNSNIDNINKNKYMENIMDNNFTLLINDASLNFIITDEEKLNEVKEDIDSSISYLDDIIKDNELKKRKSDDVRIDIPLDDMPILKKEENPYEEVIDVEPFVNIPYEESRAEEISPEIIKLEEYLKKFDILKARLKEKGKYNSLDVKEVQLYNKLESELINLKEGKRKRINIKIRFYFRKLEKKLKLDKDNYYKYLVKKGSGRRK